MATLTHAESRRLYSWWWDSHISPKNSKWLQENLTDMDVKVKAMLKLITEDADSFARRAEMYYKKRPELIKLVEEFYRAYRALAERYDHATGALRQAHRTMAEAFPNQLPLVVTDDSPLGSSPAEAEPHTPEMAHPIRAIFDPDDLQKDSLGVSSNFQATKRNGVYTEDNAVLSSKKGLKQLNDMFDSGDTAENARFFEGKVRKGLKFQGDEKKDFDSVGHDVPGDIQKHKLEDINEFDSKTRSLQDEVSQLSTTNENLKTKVLSETQRADQAETQIESLRKILSKLESEKESAVLQYKKCLERVSTLETEISSRQADISKLNGEIMEGATRLKSTEERLVLLEKGNQSLQAEMDSLVHKATIQEQELRDKNEELEKLSMCIQDERMHLMHAEAALQSLQNLHSHSLEEQKTLALELQQGVRMLKDMELKKQGLENEIQRLTAENDSLNEQNLSSAMSIKSLQEEIFSLKEVKEKLEEEVGLRVDERNALQQELYCLREELNDLNRKYQAVMEQIESVGLDASSLRSSIKELQDENIKLKEKCRDNDHEREVLTEKLANMDKLLEKNALLENSLSDASAELDGLRERLKTLEESFQTLQVENSTLLSEKCLLVSQVENITQNMNKLDEKNSVLENSLSEINVELEGLKAKAESLQQLCQVLEDEKSSLALDRNDLASQLGSIRQCLYNLEKKHAELEYKHSCLEKERESALHCIDELQRSLNLEKQEHANYFHSSQSQLTTLGNQLDLLQEEFRWRKQQLEEEQDKLVNAETEIFVLQRCILDMKEKNFSLSMECLEHVEASAHAKTLIAKLEQQLLEQKMKMNSLMENNEMLRSGVHCVVRSLDINVVDGLDRNVSEETFPLILGKIQGMHNSSSSMEDEKQQLAFEKMVSATLLDQLRLDALDLESVKNALEWESATKTKDLLMLQSEKLELLELNGHLRQDLHDRSQKVELLMGEVDSLKGQLSDLRKSYQTLKKEMSDVNQTLKKEIYSLREENHMLDEENSSIIKEAMILSNLSLIFESICSEKALELKILNDELDHLHKISRTLQEVRVISEKVEAENRSLKESVATLERFRIHSLKLEDELSTVRILSEQLKHEVELCKQMLNQKEIESSQALQKLKAIECERAELHEEALGLRLRNEQLNTELQGKTNEVELLEEEATTLHEHLLISAICSKLFEEKAYQLISSYHRLEENAVTQEATFNDINARSATENEELKEKVSALETENEGLKAEMASYLPLFLSLKDSVSSLETQTKSLAKLHLKQNEETQVSPHSHLSDINDLQPSEVHGSTAVAGAELQAQIRAIEKTMLELGMSVSQQSSNKDARLNAALKEIDELKSRNSLVQQNVAHTRKNFIQQKKDRKPHKDVQLQNFKAKAPTPDPELLMKDIQLDHVSDSSYDNYTDAGCNGRRGKSESDDQMLELWESAEQGLSVELSMRNKSQKLSSSTFDDVIEYHEIEPVEEQKSEYPSSELQVDKEMGLAVDKLEVPVKVLQPQVGDRKILERLASDARRLANLQASAQELKKKFEKFEKANQLVGFEYDTVKAQLKEVNEAISHLVNSNGKLTKNVEFSYGSGDKADDSEGMRMRRRQVSQRARRWSEKIGRLELEVQRIHFVMLKLESECENRGKRAFDRSTRVVLRDYLYGVRDAHRRKRKVHLCSCVRPPTKGD